MKWLLKDDQKGAIYMAEVDKVLWAAAEGHSCETQKESSKLYGNMEPCSHKVQCVCVYV